MANQTFLEMCRVAEDRLTYLNEMLQSSEFYLDHDRKQEQAENEKQRQLEEQAAEQRIRDLQAEQAKNEDEKQKRKQATEAFYENMKKLNQEDLNLSAKPKKSGKKREPEVAVGQTIALGGDDDEENDHNYEQHGDGHFLDEKEKFNGLHDEDEEEDGDYNGEGTEGMEDEGHKSGKRKSSHKRDKKRSEKGEHKRHKKSHKKSKKEHRRLKKGRDTGDADPTPGADVQGEEAQ